jgi:hypothetical protein
MITVKLSYPLVQISYADDTTTRHITHRGAAAALLKPHAAIRNIWCRDRRRQHYALTPVTIEQEILPRVRARDRQGLIETFEILAY